MGLDPTREESKKEYMERFDVGAWHDFPPHAGGASMIFNRKFDKKAEARNAFEYLLENFPAPLKIVVRKAR